MGALFKGGLLAAFLLQVVALGVLEWSRRGQDLEVGKPLPFEILDGDGEVVDGLPSPCRVAFVCSTECPFFAALADSMSRIDFDTIPGNRRPLWLVSGDTEQALAWGQSHGIARENIRTLTPRSNGPFLPSTRGRIWFTPLRLLLDGSLQVRDARPSDVLPSQTEAADLCRSGGIAPRSLDEFRRYILQTGQARTTRHSTPASRSGEG